MSKMNIVLPAMGEGVIEATINKWLVKTGTEVKEDDPIVEVATDKVDSEVPSPVEGKIESILAKEGEIVKVGSIIAIIETGNKSDSEEEVLVNAEVERVRETIRETRIEKNGTAESARELKSRTPSGKFLSPLVRNIALNEKISFDELDSIKGTGMDGRITRDDVLMFLDYRKEAQSQEAPAPSGAPVKKASVKTSEVGRADEIIEMDRVRKLIADHMVLSKKTSPHVTSFIDADVTRMILWRNSVKDSFLKNEGIKLTLTPVFIDATARALYEFPMLNISVDGYKIIRKKDINIGMATALPDGNLIVPVIKNANEKSLTGLARNVNDLAERARSNKLKPDEISGGTFTVTNFGSYNNLAGTPIINQPQAAILGTGAVRKMPAVVETRDGDMIAIRHIMILSLSYDHRVIDGALAGKFLGRLKEILENYSSDIN